MSYNTWHFAKGCEACRFTRTLGIQPTEEEHFFPLKPKNNPAVSGMIFTIFSGMGGLNSVS
jgi:hypothetical protein